MAGSYKQRTWAAILKPGELKYILRMLHSRES